jgi:alpha-tubulin suppressor-like RCC1 family protein
MKKLLLLFLVFVSSKSFSQVIAAGEFHSLFRCSDSSAMSGGYNPNGQLGDSTRASCRTGLVSLVGDVAALAGGARHSLFLKSDGTVWAVGNAQYGQLGVGTPLANDYFTPVQIPGLSGIHKIAAGAYTSLFLKNDGTVWGCGMNSQGELGNGSTSQVNAPVQVTGLSGIIDITVNAAASHFLKSNGTVYGSGSNYLGQVGDGTTTDRLTPVLLPSLSSIVSLSKGAMGSHTFFLKSDGTVWGCGENTWGQLGDGTMIDAETPVQITYPTNIKDIATGTSHTVFRTGDGKAWACGSNSSGQLGDTTLNDRDTPVQVYGLSDILYVAAGCFHSIFGKQDGTTYACGNNEFGQLAVDYCDWVEHPTALQTVNVCPIVSGQPDIAIRNLSIKISPNPFHSSFIIHSPSSLIHTLLCIYNSVGEKIFSTEINNEEQSIELRVGAGIYFIEANGRMQKLVAY